MKYELNLGKAEMDILRHVAERHPVSVRDVADHAAETKGHVRTTVLNTMERLRKKGFLTRAKRKGVFEYSPAKSKAALFEGLLRDFVNAAFGGSHDPLVSYFTGQTDVSDAELKMLKRLAAKLDKGKEDRG